MRPGDRVQHREWGAGVIVALKFGRRALVRFDVLPGLPRTVFVDAMAKVDGNESNALASRPAAERSPAMRAPTRLESDADLATLRQTMEALRIGVVPARFVREYTVGRENELASLEAMLDTGRGLRVLWGDYGNGKTHMLDVLERVGLERNFIVARVTLDPNEVPTTHPKRLYRAIVSSLTYPGDGGQGLDPLMLRLVDSQSHRDPRGLRASPFFSAYLHALRLADAEAIGWARDYVSGDNINGIDLDAVLRSRGWLGPRPLTLSDFRTYGRMYVHLLGTVASWAKDAGYRGLFLLFDEVEGVDALDETQIGYAIEVLKHYAAATLPKEDLAFDPDNHAHLYQGGHRVHRRISLVFEKNQPLCVAFALTPLDRIRERFAGIMRDGRCDVPLSPLTRRHMENLVTRVTTLYQRAYPSFAPGESDLTSVRSSMQEAIRNDTLTARDIVRSSVFLLDAERLRGWRSSHD